MKLPEVLVRKHSKIPYLRHVPAKNIAVVLIVALVNAIVWTGCGIALSYNRSLTGTAVLAYTLGLRHALDADHIAAIDLLTRRLIALERTPTTVGLFFALGHSTIVIVTSIAVAATAASLSSRFDDFSRIGGTIGTSVSTGVIWLLAIGNTILLVKAWIKLRRGVNGQVVDGVNKEEALGGGVLMRVFGRALNTVDRSWKMYPVGVLFGLGFDTSSEIALLGIASIEGAKGTSIWLILIFPALFTSGMALLDTLDGALMSALYLSARASADPLVVLYYTVVLSFVTVIVAIIIGILQALNLALHVGGYTGKFWDGVEAVGDKYEIVGASIVALFIVVGVSSVLLYPRWRAAVERKRVRQGIVVMGEESDVLAVDGGEVGKKVDEEDGRGGKKDATVSEGVQPVALGQ